MTPKKLDIILDIANAETTLGTPSIIAMTIGRAINRDMATRILPSNPNNLPLMNSVDIFYANLAERYVVRKIQPGRRTFATLA